MTDNSGLEFTSFDPAHLDKLHLADIYDTDPNVLKRWRLLGENIKNMGIATTVWVNGEVLACVAVVRLYHGVGEVWTLASKRVNKHPLGYIKALRRGITIHMQVMNLWRLHGTIRADFEGAEKWVKTLGFEKEGLLKKYGPSGEDHIMFARVI